MQISLLDIVTRSVKTKQARNLLSAEEDSCSLKQDNMLSGNYLPL